MKFLQILEFRTTRLDEVRALDEEWRQATTGTRTATAITMTKDRDRPDTYLWMIEFPSYEDAMRNNELPATQKIAEQMAALTDGPTEFRNVDVLDETAL